VGALAKDDLQTKDEKFVEELATLQGSSVQPPLSRAELQADLSEARQQVEALQEELDTLYLNTFGDVKLPNEEGDTEGSAVSFEGINEAAFSALGRNDPSLMKRLMASVSADTATWMSFQSAAQDLVLRRSRATAAVESLKSKIEMAARRERQALSEKEEEDDESVTPRLRAGEKTAKIVLITGFESFNVKLYRKVSKDLKGKFPGLKLIVFSDRDIANQRPQVEAALDGADVFFGSLLFDYDQVEWLRERVAKIPIRLVFESALELMGQTQIGTFQMAPDGKSKGPQ